MPAEYRVLRAAYSNWAQVRVSYPFSQVLSILGRELDSHTRSLPERTDLDMHVSALPKLISRRSHRIVFCVARARWCKECALEGFWSLEGLCIGWGVFGGRSVPIVQYLTKRSASGEIAPESTLPTPCVSHVKSVRPGCYSVICM